MHNGNRNDLVFPRATELIADATAATDHKSSGWFKRVVRRRDKDGTVVWSDDDDDDEDVEESMQGLHYDPLAPPGQYYVLPMMYVPSQREINQAYNIEQPTMFATDLYRDEFYTDIRSLKATKAEGISSFSK